MRLLRFVLAAIVVVAAIFFGVFALAIVAAVGLAALVVQSFRRQTAAGPRSAPDVATQTFLRQPAASGDVIDVEATETVSDKP